MQRLVQEEMSQPLLTNKEQGKMRLWEDTNIIKPNLAEHYLKKYFYFHIKP
jgi:hypothetical protein